MSGQIKCVTEVATTFTATSNLLGTSNSFVVSHFVQRAALNQFCCLFVIVMTSNIYLHVNHSQSYLYLFKLSLLKITNLCVNDLSNGHCFAVQSTFHASNTCYTILTKII